MAKKKIAAKKQTQQSESAIDIILRFITGVYIGLVLLALPLYAPEGYYSIGFHKWQFWIYTTTAYVAIMAVVYVVKYITYLRYRDTKYNTEQKFNIKKWLKENVTILDYFVLAYLLICLISSIFSPFKDQIWGGAEGWNMGLWSQLGFVFGYFLISRTWKYSNTMVRIAILVSCSVYANALAMRFGNDPLGFYVGLSEQNKFDYISTLGQTSWYSSYLALLVPMAIMAYALSKSLLGRVLSGLATALGFMSMVTQSSDSAYLAFAGFTFVFFWIAFNSNELMLRFWEVLIIAFASFKFIGIMQVTHPDTAVYIGGISTVLSQGTITWIALIAVTVVYIVLRLIFAKNNTFNITKISFIRYIVSVLAILAICLGVTYIALNTMGRLSGNLASDNNYLLFNEYWGNLRGFTWKNAVRTFVEEGFGRKLIGSGPDTFGPSMYSVLGEDEIYEFFYSVSGLYYVVYCAHNEWLNMLITEGILGLIAYLGMYIVCIVRCIKYGKEKPHLYGIAMAMGAYIAHNFFCYQQVICTSVIIVFMGLAEALIRNGHTDRDKWDMEDDGKSFTVKDIFKAFMGG